MAVLGVGAVSYERAIPVGGPGQEVEVFAGHGGTGVPRR